MKIGKLPTELLEKLVFDNIENKREEVLVGAALGEDNAIVDFGQEVCVLSTDPITGTSKSIGSLAINISCNDVASSGAEPIGILLTIMAPEDTSEQELKELMMEASSQAKKLNLEIMGGHTEITDAVNRIVVSTTVIGKQDKSKLLSREDLAPGYGVYVSKTLGIEGSSILAWELEEDLSEFLRPDELEEAKALGQNISVLKEGRLGGQLGVNYMHDITEGGLFGALWEASESLGFGMEIYEDSLPLEDVTRKITDTLKIDPYRLISSGSMLIVAHEEVGLKMKEELSKLGIGLTHIGSLREGPLVIVGEDGSKTIDPPESDELYRALKVFK